MLRISQIIGVFMAFDGITIAALVKELQEKLLGGRVMKIIQPEKDQLIVTIKNYNQYKLLLSADAGLPLIYLTQKSYEAPLNSPAFCMLLRKHLMGGKITGISQPDFERIVRIDFEHLDEMGDLKTKTLVFELMGKHSNIIFCDDTDTVIDSIKRVPASVSSVREVLPGRPYFVARTLDKLNPLLCEESSFCEKIGGYPGPLYKGIYGSYTGISPLMANEAVFRAGFDSDLSCSAMDGDLRIHAFRVFRRMMDEVREGTFLPEIIYKGEVPVDYCVIEAGVLKLGGANSSESFDSVSTMLEEFYARKNTVSRVKQRSADISKVITNAIARASKKYELQLGQLEDTEKRDVFRVYGEMLMTYGYQVQDGASSCVVSNYYTGEDIEIPLDSEFSAIENGKRYFDKYSKLKRTYEAQSQYIVETKAELRHLESVKMALELAEGEEDLAVIRDELAQFGYMKSEHRQKNGGPSKKNYVRSGRKVSKPYRYVTDEGFEIYVGRNNYQNDELTFKFAEGGDWWFHAKGIPGSHVILKTAGRDIPDEVFEKAAGLAAFYSSGRESDKVEVDYIERKHVKKPSGAKPGFVVYYTNYSMVAVPSEKGLELSLD